MKRFDYIYDVTEGGTRYIKSIVPSNGYKLFEVEASYYKAKQFPKYYVIAKNSREAKNIFKYYYGDVLSVIKSVSITDDKTSDDILNRYYENIRIVI